MTAITIDEDVRLDLGHTDLVGTLSFDGEGLLITSPSGTTQLLGHHLYTRAPGDVRQAPLGHILIEEVGLARALPAALLKSGHARETARHEGLSPWGADVVELLVITPGSSEPHTAESE